MWWRNSKLLNIIPGPPEVCGRPIDAVESLPFPHCCGFQYFGFWELQRMSHETVTNRDNSSQRERIIHKWNFYQWPRSHLAVMWCRCCVKYDFYYCMAFEKCSAVDRSWGPLSSEETDCDLETLVSFKMSTFPESEDSHKQPKRNGFHVCGTRVDGRVTVYVK